MSQHVNEPIAIIGSACRFAGDAISPSALWKLLEKPHDVLSKIPANRFSAKGFHHQDGLRHGHCNVEHSYVLSEDPSAFDAQFFGVKPVEARALDPQQRLLLEVAYEGLESACLPMENLRGSDTGVFVGLMCGDYEALLLRDFQSIPTYHSVGTARSVMSNRISYFFDWRGPSMTIDTACSSSLVAVHLATRALRAGDSRVALACGSNLLLGPENYVAESKLRMLSPDGRSRMWDQDANGYARGDGIAVLVLKTLSAAIEDGDNIECVIRETGVNHDGATQGITMPSATAQEDLIHDTYARAGLDVSKAEDRCQYFEAHGTGTPAGDPIEAEAIHRVFGGSGGQNFSSSTSRHPLYVGSIKTVLGHTEGTAGIAGILKAALALQSSRIPPNMLFNNLSPKVAPFYANLHIPTTAKIWPDIAPGNPRRASVNSFGFGGANAHAILESYEPTNNPAEDPEKNSFAPFVFSAGSEKSLLAVLSSYSDFLNNGGCSDARDLAWTLFQRKTALPFRISFPGGSTARLREAIVSKLQDKETAAGTKALGSSASNPPRILAVFTGQGAQYARMGAEMIERSPFARSVIQELEAHLSRLPEGDRPSWSLETELLADTSSTRLNEAAISQPLCTAIQILLVKLLRLANVRLDGVVGHSSGEIAAAYAAGYLSSRDAMCIAYYRGLHCKTAASPNSSGIPGAMLAVGTTVEDASELCELPEFAGRASVAAINSASSLTISGDSDAIAELEDIFEDEKKFRRRLRVDRAYHSSHMLPCSKPYMESLRASGVQVLTPPPNSCHWYSSVYEGAGDDFDKDKLAGPYWVDNMVRPVLFSHALEKAVASTHFDIALEIGAHPALKGPASQNILDFSGRELPYSGLLSRGVDAVEAMSNALGFLWTHLDRRSIDIANYEELVSGEASFTLVKNLPSYPWDHDTKYWHESRISRNFRQRAGRVHPLLGDVTPDSSPHHLSWRNLLRTREMEWMPGHQLQNQTVFPAAGYLASAIEASWALAVGKGVQLIELENFVIHQSIAFDDDDSGIETLVSLIEVNRCVRTDTIQAKFTYSAAIGKEPETFTLAASGIVRVRLGESSETVLPQRRPRIPHMIDVESDRFYGSLADMGYIYSGDFRGLSSLKRKLGHASGLVNVVSCESSEDALLVHPATLDCALQSIILAYSYPSDGRLWSLHVPTGFSRLRINPSLCGHNWSEAGAVAFDSATVDRDGAGILGDVDIFGQDSQNVAIQLEGMRAVPFAEATSASDRKIFSQTSWKNMDPDGEVIARDDAVTDEEEDLAYVLERISTFYTRKFDHELPVDHPARTRRPFSDYLNFCRHMNELQQSGRHVYAKKEWLNDTLDDIMVASARYDDAPDVKIMKVVGEQMPRVFRGETTILEHLRPNNLLDDYYVGALGFPKFSKWLGRTVSQITHRYPHMNILEIGAGTGGATKSILRMIGNDFTSYTFTDISSGFFETAQSVLTEYKDRMIFKAFDAERDPASQGFTPGSYDLIVASFVIHATGKLDVAMRNVRKLLRPGGYVAFAESTNNDQTRAGFIFGTLPGWWAGVDEGRVLSPCVSAERWDAVLRSTGFSGIDTITPEHFETIYAGSVFVSQAVDDRISFLREPLVTGVPDLPANDPLLGDVIILGGRSLGVARLIANITKILRPYSRSMTIFKTLGEVDTSTTTTGSTILSLTELEKPVFQHMTPVEFEAFKSIFQSEKAVMWVTSGRRADDPFSNMVAGFGRTAVHEVPELRLQLLDFEARSRIDARELAESLLQLKFAGEIAKGGGSNDLLWSIEPEVVFGSDGSRLIPRQGMRPDANDRYNSERRPLTRSVDIDNSNAVILQKEGHDYCVLDASPSAGPSHLLESTIELKTTLCVVSAIKTRLGHRFIVLGVNRRTGAKLAALTESLASIQYIPENTAVPYEQRENFSDAQSLALLATSLISRAVVDSAFPGQALLIHNPTHLMAWSVSRLASAKGVNVAFSTNSSYSDVPPSWIRFLPCTPKREVQQLLPKHLSSFWEISPGTGHFSTRESILSLLPGGCRVETSNTIFSDSSSAVPEGLTALLGEEVRDAIDCSRDEDPNLAIPSWDLETIGIVDIARGVKPGSPLSIVAWDSPSPWPVRVRRLSSKPLFRADRTYWLVGLSGTLGLSLCDWMVNLGAKYLVISSRNPAKIDPAWIETNRQRGATVKLFANDVTNEKDVQILYRTISETLPPLSGVIQGAMVLKDTTIHDMNFSQMADVLRPRVQGTLHLDKIIDKDLDFFILLSSMTGVIGNMGQANYTTANAFMSGLAAHRRKRGLAASVVNVGVIIGAGYVTREVSNMDEKRLDRGGMMRMSETDFHQMIAEAIEAGRPGSDQDPELSTGLREIPEDSPFLPTWHDNPKFSRFVLRESATNSDKGMEKAGLSIKQRLEAAEIEEDLRALIKETLGAKLRAVLQMDTKDDSLMGMRTDEIGLDSLIAVDIRSWFLKNYEVGIPVLKILGGARIIDLVEQALDELPASLTPNIKRVLGDSQAAQATSETADSTSDVNLSQSAPGSLTPSSSTHSSVLDVLLPPAEVTITEPSVSSIDAEVDPIPKPKIGKSSSVSFSQSIFWFVHSLMEDETTLNHTGLFRIAGDLRVDDLRRAVKGVGQHHEALRTCFYVDENQNVVQGVLDASILCLEQAQVHQDSDVTREFEEMKAHVYDIAAGQVMRIRLLTSSLSINYLLIGCHHINVDGISQQVLLADLERVYKGQPLDPNVLQYPDYAAKQRADAENGAFNNDISFWKEEFATIPEPLPLTRSRISTRQPLAKYTANTVDLRIDTPIADRIRTVSREYRSTSFHFYLTAFEILLHRLTGTEDFSIGIADGNRKDESTLACFGPILNLLPLRFRVAPRSFCEELSDTRAKTYAALAHSRVPFEVLLNELRVTRSPAHSPVFQAFVDYRQGMKEKCPFADLSIELLSFEPGRTAYDLSIDIIDNPGGDALISVIGQGALYSKTDVQVIAELYEDILLEFSSQPQKGVTGDWKFRDTRQTHSLDLGRGTSFTSSWPDTLLHRFDAVVDKNKHKTATTTASGTSMTYEELAKRTDAIAQALLEASVQAGDRVAMYQTSGCDWVCSMLAVLKVGAVYIPLDTKTRASRLAAVVADCKPVAVLIDEAHQTRYRDLAAPHLAVINIASLPNTPSRDIEVLAAPDSPAIILYTSGSTGKPKGVVLKHSNFRHEVEISAEVFGLGPDVVVLQQSSFSFDMSVLQIFLAVSLGGRLHMIPEDMRGDSLAITDSISEQKVTFTCATPSEYTSWLRYGNQDHLRSSSWTAALSGGESVTEDLLTQFRSFGKEDLRLFNGYGPTETTCCSTKTELRYQPAGVYPDGIPAGRASPNESIYIIDEHLRLLPIGLPGEIAISGAGVASGYLNMEARTHQSFISDPYAKEGYAQRGWTAMYRTKDHGRLLSDGSLLVEGRIGGDTEIKLRGMRVNLRDVEQAILSSANGTISEAVVSAPSSSAGSNAAQILVGHIVFAPGGAPADPESYLRRLLRELPLPEYMCPSMLVPIDRLPRTASGKLDRNVVSSLPITQSRPDILALKPMSAMEVRLKAIWLEALSSGAVDTSQINSESDFFHVGGTSMLLVAVQAKIRQQLELPVPLVKLFNSSTLSSMARLIDQNVESHISVDWDSETTPIPVAPYPVPQNTIPAATTPRVILLTGAAGNLGRHILQRLLETPSVDKVICIAVRQLQQRLDANHLPRSDRVTYHEGDLRLPLLGLSEAECSSIFGEVDAVIHNGAEVSHLKTYPTLRAANVSSTKELAHLCLPRHIPIHYISSAQVATLKVRDAFGEVSARDAPPQTDGSDGYAASKWASERVLERMSEAFGLRVWIHRPSSITQAEGSESGGHGDLIQDVLRYSRKLKAVPVSENLYGTLDFISVKNASGNIIRDVLSNEARVDRGVAYVHQAGDLQIPLRGMKEYLERENGGVEEYEELPIKDWAAKAEQEGLDSMVATLVGNVENLGTLMFPKLVKVGK
ncbi:related to polyketide synthase [Cephalotrichum gorgonifer]|uniref:Related to polyketide synthase n=1 Tax=Cephalotrichum gorgonifer TaxID=2041049 RepID=A0AAE8MY88_9PEZI|nr:related to polyketide synthase [Cephalotrichum gorgonifer]